MNKTRNATSTFDDLNKMTEAGYYHPKVMHRPSINLENLIQICS